MCFAQHLTFVTLTGTKELAGVDLCAGFIIANKQNKELRHTKHREHDDQKNTDHQQQTIKHKGYLYTR